MAQEKFTRQLTPQKGLWISAPADSIGPEYSPWCQNVRFRFGKIMRAPGRSISLQTLGSPILGFAEQTDASGNKTIYGLDGTNSALAYDVATHQFGAPRSLQMYPRRDSRFSWTAGEEQLLIVRASEISALSPSGITQVASPAGMFIEYFKNHVFLMNIVADTNSPNPMGPMPNRVQWSTLGNYADWAVGLDGTGHYRGGFVDLYEGTVEPITGGKLLNDRLVVYRNSSIVDFSATGDASAPFIPEGKVYGIGCMLPWSLVSVGQAHIFVANDFNVYSWDGVNLNPIGSPIHSYLRKMFDPSIAYTWQNMPFAAAFMGFKEYWLVIPDQVCGKWTALIFDYFRNSWTRDSFHNLNALAEHILPGAVGTSGYNEHGYPKNYPQLLAASDNGYFLIDERICGDWFWRPDDGGMDMFVDTPDMFYDQTALQNATLQRVMVSDDYPTPDGPAFKLEVSVDRGNSFPYQRALKPFGPYLGFDFVDMNITSNVRRYRFFYPKENGSARPTLRAYTDVYVPSGEFFPTRKAVNPRDPFVPPTHID